MNVTSPVAALVAMRAPPPVARWSSTRNDVSEGVGTVVPADVVAAVPPMAAKTAASATRIAPMLECLGRSLIVRWSPLRDDPVTRGKVDIPWAGGHLP